jgi:hemerythrin-like domain-containing protein
VDSRFIEAAVDFIRTYADQIHHGKEEDLLFTALRGKPLSLEHQHIMQELQEDHQWGRQTTASLMAAKDKFVMGRSESLTDILESMTALVEFYPKHIEKEDQHFFLPVMAYFSQKEKEALLAQMSEFDRGFIHAKYQKLVADWGACGCKCHL